MPNPDAGRPADGVLPRSEVVSRLRAAGCVFAEQEAELLCSAAGDAAELADLLQRRVAGLPLEHLLGHAHFAGRRVVVRPGVFVPRRRTELPATRALELAGQAGQHPVVVELCCGAAAVAAVVAAGAPHALVHAADIDDAAVRCARENLPGGHVHRGDLYAALPDGLRGRIDVLVANAPYVPTERIATMPPEAREHEPRGALDGGADGLSVQRRVVAGAPEWLAPGGHLLIETSRHQAPRTAECCTAHGLHPSIEQCDELDATMVLGRAQAASARSHRTRLRWP